MAVRCSACAPASRTPSDGCTGAATQLRDSLAGVTHSGSDRQTSYCSDSNDDNDYSDSECDSPPTQSGA